MTAQLRRTISKWRGRRQGTPERKAEPRPSINHPISRDIASACAPPRIWLPSFLSATSPSVQASFMVLNMIDPQPGYPHNTMPSTSPATITKNGGKGKGSEEIAAPPVKMNGASFADLPDECLERVFGFLELADVLALGRVSEQWLLGLAVGS